MLIRCPHCNHRIMVRNARPRSYELDCPSCHRPFFALIERESGPDQRVTVFLTLEQMTQQILEARAARPVSKYRPTEPQARPENPESHSFDTQADTADLNDDFSDQVVRDRPDVPKSLVGMNEDKIEDVSNSSEVDLQGASRVMPSTHPVAYSNEDEHLSQDLLAELQKELNEQLLSAQSSEDEAPLEQTVLRPDTPRPVAEEEMHIYHQRPEFSSVDEVIPRFPSDMQHQHIHEQDDAESSLVTDADDVQAAEPTDLLNLEEDDNEHTTDTNEKEIQDKSILFSESNDQTKKNGWFRWLRK